MFRATQRCGSVIKETSSEALLRKMVNAQLAAESQQRATTMRVLVCAGGTGGGIYPALTAVSALRDGGVETEDILWVGTVGEMEETLVEVRASAARTIQDRGHSVAGLQRRADHRFPQSPARGS